MEELRSAWAWALWAATAAGVEAWACWGDGAASRVAAQDCLCLRSWSSCCRVICLPAIAARDSCAASCLREEKRCCLKVGHHVMRAWGSEGALALQAVKVASMAVRAWRVEKAVRRRRGRPLPLSFGVAGRRWRRTGRWSGAAGLEGWQASIKGIRRWEMWNLSRREAAPCTPP